jgi:hypothetical protein
VAVVVVAQASAEPYLLRPGPLLPPRTSILSTTTPRAAPAADPTRLEAVVEAVAWADRAVRLQLMRLAVGAVAALGLRRTAATLKAPAHRALSQARLEEALVVHPLFTQEAPQVAAAGVGPLNKSQVALLPAAAGG